MKLTIKQINEYRDNGFLILENLFKEAEVQLLKEGIVEINNTVKPNIIKDKTGETRSAFVTHDCNDNFSWFCNQDRLVKPIQQLLNNSSIYLYRYKFNDIKASVGATLGRDEDHPSWQIDDGVEEWKVLSVVVLLQDTYHTNGPLMFMPKSQAADTIEFDYESNPSEGQMDFENSENVDVKLAAKRSFTKEVTSKNGIKPITGKIGTAIIFNSNLYNEPNRKILPSDIGTATLTYCSEFRLF